MNVKQLEVFLAVAETGSFSRGAEATLLTQSTVSQHVAALEEELGLTLFDRTGRGARLTEGGKVLLERAKRVVAEMEEIRETIRRFRGVETGLLKVGGSNIPGIYMIPPVLGSLLADHPGLEVTVLQGDSRDIVEKLGHGDIEVGVVGGTFPVHGISYTPLGTDHLQLVVPYGHPWRGRRCVTIGELAAAPLIMREAGSGTAKTVTEALEQAGLSPARLQVTARLGSNEAVKQAVISGLGVSFLSCLSVDRELAARALATVAVEGLALVRTFSLAYRTGRDLSPAGRLFMSAMEEWYATAQKLPPG